MQDRQLGQVARVSFPPALLGALGQVGRNIRFSLFGDLNRRSRRWVDRAGRRAYIGRAVAPWGRRGLIDPDSLIGRFAARRAAWGRQRAFAAAGRPRRECDLLNAGLAEAYDVVINERAVATDVVAEGNVEGGLVAVATFPRLRDALTEVGPPQPEPLVFPSVSPRAPARLRLASVR